MARLIVLEGDPEVRQLICFVLHEAGHYIIAAVGSSAELDPVQVGLVDQIFCDVGFLTAADLACVAELKRLFPNVVIVGTSAAIHNQDAAKMSETTTRAGLVMILSKPFSIEALLKAVSQPRQ